MRVNRGLLFWGLALVTAGLLALAVQGGAIPRETIGQAWRLWPLILVAIGIAILASRTPFAVMGTVLAALVLGAVGGSVLAGGPFGFSVCEPGETTQVSSGSGAFGGSSASVALDFNCGELTVGMGSGREWSVEARRSGGPEARLVANEDSLRVETPQRGWGGWAGDRHAWDVILPRDVAEMTHAALDGDFKRARELHFKLYPMARAAFLETNPIPIKEAMAMAGMIEPEFRLPMCRMSEANRTKLAAVVKSLGLTK